MTDRRTELRQQYHVLHYMQSHSKNVTHSLQALIRSLSPAWHTSSSVLYSQMCVSVVLELLHFVWVVSLGILNTRSSNLTKSSETLALFQVTWISFSASNSNTISLAFYNTTQTKLDNLCQFSQRCSPTPHFGGAPRWLNPQIRNQPRFLYNAPTPKFHHPMFTHSEVIVLTNKQT